MAYTYDFLKDVKNALNITGSYQDNTLKTYIFEVKEYLKRAGVDKSLLNSRVCAGVISRGVADLWNLGAGNGALSPYFYDRVSQLALSRIREYEPSMSYITLVPNEADYSTYGWISTSLGPAKNMSAKVFTLDDIHDARVTLIYPDGSQSSEINTETGTRRSVTIDGSRIILMPSTKYDISQSKFITDADSFAISLVSGLEGCEIILEAFEKGCLNV